MSPAPESGASLSPTELRFRVLDLGWRPLPVIGKAPTPTDWTRYCRVAPTPHEVELWSRAHGAAMSTGLALGEQVAIDIDVASNALLAAAVRGIAEEVFGTTPFIRVGRPPKLALIYRAGPGVTSTSHKAADGSGDGIDVLADGRQVVGFGRHKDTGLPYTWTGEASPLDARPDAAPVITGEQVAEFLARVEGVLPLHGGTGTGRKGGGQGSSEEIVRGVSGLVVNGRERFLTSCVWRAANALHTAKVEITAEVLGGGAWALFSDPERGASLEDGKWRKADALYKARATVRRLQAGTVGLGQGAAEAEGTAGDTDPTYPDISVTVSEARAALQAAVDAHFEAGTGHRAVKIGTGCGKTRAAVRAIVADIRRRRAEGDRSAALFLTPTLALADEVAELFRAEGITARTFRGRGAEDPGLPGAGRAMCWDLEGVDLALRLDLTVSTACCRLKDRDTGKIHLCPHFTSCGYQRQVAEVPDVWCGAHDLAFSAPAGLGEVSSVTIDEGWWQTGLRIAKRGTTLDDLSASPGLGRNTFETMAAADIAAWRSQLVAALRRQEGTGGVVRRHLVEGGITVEMCNSANAAEWRMRDRVQFYPGMPGEARRAAARAAVATGKISKASAVWRAARDLLERDDEDAVSGRLVLADAAAEDGSGQVRTVRTHGLRKILARWQDLPILLLDATLPPVEVLRQFLPDVKVVADIEAEARHAKIRQILGAPVSRRKLLTSEAGRNREAVRRALLLRWVELGRPKTLVVCQKEFEAWLQEAGLPEGIAVAHYNAIEGLDGFKDVGLLVAIGRTLPDVFEVETYAGTLSGLEPVRTVAPEKGLRWYARTPLALRMADGTGHLVQGDRHPDVFGEAARWQVCEAGVLQAIGRARAVNRTAADPVQIDVWSDLALPLTVDEAVAWDAVPAGYEADMIADGIGLESAPDMAVCWPAVWETEKAAKRWREKATGPLTLIETLLYRVWGPCGSEKERVGAFRYQHAGERQRWRRGWHDPAIVLDPRAWLEAKLGVLVGFEIVSRG